MKILGWAKHRFMASKNDEGSMPIALFVTVMFLALSVGITSIVVSQISQNRAEDNARLARWSLSSAIAQAAERIGTSPRAISGVATTEPTEWSSLGINNQNAFSHWWVSSSSNAVLNPSTLPSGNWKSATFGNNIWVAINDSGVSFTSPDAVTWTQRNALPSYATLAYTHLTYGLGYFIATPSTAATSIAISTDGIAWTNVTVPSGLYVPSCSSTTCVLLSSAVAGGVYTTNLSTFTAIPSFPFITNAVSFAQTTFVAVGNGTLATSQDGVNWTTQTVAAHNWGVVSAVNGQWAIASVNAAGSNNIMTSPDALAWTAHALPQSGNWVAMVTAGPQMALFSGPIGGINQSTYLATSDGISWVSSPLLAASTWIGGAGNYKSFFIYPTDNTGYVIPISLGVQAAQSLTVSTRVQVGRITSANNGQYLATMSFNWSPRSGKWVANKFLGASASSLSVAPDAPTGVIATRTARGTVVISWIPPTDTGSSAVVSYTATATPTTSGGYICPSGGTLSGTTCTLLTTSAATLVPGHYTCTAGDVLSGTTCTNTSTYAATNHPQYYSCTAGDVLLGSTCTNTTTYAAINGACNAGDTLSGSTCIHVTTYAATNNAQYYSCNTGDTLSGSRCTVVTTYAATWVPATYSCSSGQTLSGSTCTATSTYAASFSPLNYSCPTGYMLVGSTCNLTASSSATINASFYSCTSGDSLSGATCTNTVTYAATSHVAFYSCTAGDVLSGTNCTNTTTYAATNNAAYYYCNAGDSLSVTTCTHLTTYAATDHPAYYYCPSGGTLSGNTCSTVTTYAATGTPTYASYPVTSNYVAGSPIWTTPQTWIDTSHWAATQIWNPSVYVPGYTSCDPGGYNAYGQCLTPNSRVWHPSYYIHGYYSPGPNVWVTSGYWQAGTPYISGYNAGYYTYSCNSGGTWNGSDCGSYQSGTSYSCPSGGSLSGSTCTLGGTYVATYSAQYYTCTAGDTLSGSTCTHATTYTAFYAAQYYSCNIGDALSGTTCTHVSTYVATYSAQYYSCTAGDTLSGSTCTHTTTYAATYNPSYYSCSSGKTLAGGQCLTATSTAAAQNSGSYTCVSTSATSCTITGMVPGTYTFTVTATNADGTSVTSAPSTIVQPQSMSLSYIATTFDTAHTQSLAPTILGGTGASLTYVETGALPSGTTFDSATGILTRTAGTPTTGYPLSISISATDNMSGISTASAVVFTTVTLP